MIKIRWKTLYLFALFILVRLSPVKQTKNNLLKKHSCQMYLYLYPIVMIFILYVIQC